MLHPPRRRHTDTRPHPTRVLLADTTARLVSERGLDALDIEEVLTEAGVTKGALYHHFESTNDLIVTALLQLYSRNVDETIAVFLSGLADATTVDDVRERLAAVTRSEQDRSRSSARLERARIFSLCPTHPMLAEQLAVEQQRLTDAIADTVQEAQARRWIKPDLDPHAVAVFIQAYTLGRIIDDVSADPVANEAWVALVDHVVESFLVT